MLPKNTITIAVRRWYYDREEAKALYGSIASWDTSAITRMEGLFCLKRYFNEDLSRWDVSNVVTMDKMFAYATSFGQVLGGSWTASTASKIRMFSHSPGQIAGKAKDQEGSVV